MTAVWEQDREIARLFTATGPVVSLYLDLTGRIENAAAHIALRWRDLRDELAAQGADPADLKALDAEVRAAQPGDSTLAAFAAGGSVLLRRVLDRPGEDRVVVGALPCVLPVLAYAQSTVPYLTVVADRSGADLAAYTVDRTPCQVAEVVGTHDEIERNAPGGWAQARYQRRAEDSWERNMTEVAHAVTDLADRNHAELVVGWGDVRAMAFLRDHLPPRARGRLRQLNHGGRHPGRGDNMHADDVRALVERAAWAHTEALLERFRAERGDGHDRAVDGPAATLAGLFEGRVETLLVVDDPADDRRAFFGAPLAEVGAHPSGLPASDDEPGTGRLADVAVRAAVGTGAAVRVLPPTVTGGPKGGVGALLRYP